MVLESLTAGVAFLLRSWGRPWFIGLIAVIAAGGALMAGTIAWPGPLIATAAVLVLPLAQAPLYSLALSNAPSKVTFAGAVARCGRLLAVNLLTAVFLGIPALLFFVVGLGVAYGMAFAYPGFNPGNAATWTANGPVLLGGGAVVAIGLLTLLWLLSRVSLGPAVSVVERRVAMLSTWPLTRGLGWRIAAARLVIGMVALAAAWIVGRVVPTVTAARIAPVVCDILFVAIGLPVEVGVLTYFYPHRSPLPVTP